MKKNFTHVFERLDTLYSTLDVQPVFDENTLDDCWQTREQRKRDSKVTNLLDLYVQAYEDKTNFIYFYRELSIKVILICLILLSAALFSLAQFAVFSFNDQTIGKVVSLITAFITFAGLIIKLLHTMINYIFPQNDEQYITKIVSSIQKNDLENKRENIQAYHNNAKKAEE